MGTDTFSLFFSRIRTPKKQKEIHGFLDQKTTTTDV